MRFIAVAFIMLTFIATKNSYGACSSEGKNLIASIQDEMEQVRIQIQLLTDRIHSNQLSGWSLHVAEFTLSQKKEDMENGQILLENTMEMTGCQN